VTTVSKRCLSSNLVLLHCFVVQERLVMVRLKFYLLNFADFDYESI